MTKTLLVLLFAISISVTVAIPASATAACTGNHSIASQLAESYVVFGVLAGEVDYAPKTTNLMVRVNVVTQLTSLLTWLEACPGSSQYTITPDTTCSYVASGSYWEFLSFASLEAAPGLTVFAEEADTPVDQVNLASVEENILGLIETLTPCETQYSPARR